LFVHLLLWKIWYWYWSIAGLRHGDTKEGFPGLFRRHHFLHPAIRAARRGISQQLLQECGDAALDSVGGAILLQRLGVSVLLLSIASFAFRAGNKLFTPPASGTQR
jgi:hypothetical protein